MIIHILAGLVLLYKGADWLVRGAASLARKFGISPLVIGLTVVAFGTSMPELVVNVFAAGNSGVTYGNIVGSSILNILLILGIAGAITPIVVKKSTVWKEIPFALLGAAILWILSDNILSRVDGAILISLFIIFLLYILRLLKRAPKGGSKENYSSLGLLIVGGLAALLLGGKLTVDGAVSFARQIGISEFLISSTIVAAGTSLPELVTSVVAVARKEMDISVGNIVGSNILNLFFIMGISAMISPVTVPMGINLDFIVLLAASILLFLFMFSGTRHRLDRWEAVLFLVLYLGYLLMVIYRG